eukprot:3614242-Rhodomonas_salina.1
MTRTSMVTSRGLEVTSHASRTGSSSAAPYSHPMLLLLLMMMIMIMIIVASHLARPHSSHLFKLQHACMILPLTAPWQYMCSAPAPSYPPSLLELETFRACQWARVTPGRQTRADAG